MGSHLSLIHLLRLLLLLIILNNHRRRVSSAQHVYPRRVCTGRTRTSALPRHDVCVVLLLSR